MVADQLSAVFDRDGYHRAVDAGRAEKASNDVGRLSLPP